MPKASQTSQKGFFKLQPSLEPTPSILFGNTGPAFSNTHNEFQQPHKPQGKTKFASSSLATFNKNIRDVISGNPLQNEEDDLPSVNFGEAEAGYEDVDQEDIDDY